MLEIKNLSVKFENEKILKDINFKAKKGNVIVISGASGSGKTTLVNTINGVIPFHRNAEVSGDILFNSKSILNEDIQERSRYLSTVFQNPDNQFFCINSTDEIAFPLENRNVKRDEILKKIEIHTKLLNTSHLKDRSLMKLSGGEKQLVAITSVSVMGEEIYLLDEPSSSLDKDSINRLSFAIKKWKEMGKIIIISEHRLYYLNEIMTDLICLENGNIVDKNYINLRSLDEITLQDLQKKHLYKKINPIKEKSSSDSEMKLYNYKYAYKKNVVIDFDINISDKKITFLIGKNGVGKSTIVNCMCGLNRKFKGFTKLNDIEFIKKGYKYCSLVMQNVNYQLFTESVFEEVKLETDDKNKIDDVLRKLNLYDKKDAHPMSLSGGQKQRVLIASVFATKKDIIVFDEPTSGLCFNSMIAIKDILLELKKQNKKVIVITHDYEFISKFNDEEIIEIYK